MIEIAARATHGVKIPTRKLTRQGILNLFWDIMTGLRDRLNVRPFFLA